MRVAPRRTHSVKSFLSLLHQSHQILANFVFTFVFKHQQTKRIDHTAEQAGHSGIRRLKDKREDDLKGRIYLQL